MLDQYIVSHCAPTLAGIKTANMFTCAYQSKQELIHKLRKLNQSLSRKGICIIPLRFCKQRVLLYVYRMSHLQRDLRNQSACLLLQAQGYHCHHPQKCLVQLVQKMTSMECFPHEVGLFLGYPPEDVQGFIEQKKHFKCVGCWKVYGDVQSATKRFERYKKCTQNYCKRWQNGLSLDQLAVTL